MYVCSGMQFLRTSFTNHVAYDACACQSRSGSTDVLYLLQQPRSIRRMCILRLPGPSKHCVYMNRHPLPTPHGEHFPFAKYFTLRMSEQRKLQARLRKRRRKSSVPADVRREEPSAKVNEHILSGVDLEYCRNWLLSACAYYSRR